MPFGSIMSTSATSTKGNTPPLAPRLLRQTASVWLGWMEEEGLPPAPRHYSPEACDRVRRSDQLNSCRLTGRNEYVLRTCRLTVLASGW